MKDIRILWILACVLASAGCSNRPGNRNPPPSLGFNLGPIEIFSRFPLSSMLGRRFRTQVVTPQRIYLDDEYELEFSAALPWGATSKGLPISTLVLTNQQKIRLSIGRVYPLGFRDWIPPQGFQTAAQRFNLDLSPFRGQTIGLKWVLGDGSGDYEGYLLSPRLRAKARTRRRPPDVLFICSDTHRYDHSLGDRGKSLMPALQELATQSVVYRRAMSTASWTLPSVTSVLTGLPPRLHLTGRRIVSKDERLGGSKNTFRWLPEDLNGLKFSSYPKELTSLPEILFSHGYLTSIVAANPLYSLSGLMYDGTQIVLNSGGSGDLLDEAAKYVLKDVPRDQPVFLLVHYMDVHDWEPRYFTKLYPKAKSATASPGQVMNAYSAAVSDCDRFLAMLLHSWRRSRDIDNTLLVFFSDHGEQLLNGIGHGNSMRQVLLHVPLVVRYPVASGIAPGVVDHNVSLEDIFATTLDVLGLTYKPLEFQGTSLLVDHSNLRPLFAGFQLYGDNLSTVIMGQQKLVRNLDTGGLELFRITDSGEGEAPTNTAADVKALDKWFQEYSAFAARHSADIGRREVIDHKKTVETLRSLGYLQ